MCCRTVSPVLEVSMVLHRVGEGRLQRNETEGGWLSVVAPGWSAIARHSVREVLLTLGWGGSRGTLEGGAIGGTAWYWARRCGHAGEQAGRGRGGGGVARPESARRER